MYNSATLIGNVGADPEIRRLASGNPVANLRVATSDRWKDKNTGERKERTEWHSIVVYNENIVRIVEEYVKKGSRILVEGPIRHRSWEKDGQKHWSAEIVLEQFGGRLVLLGSPGNGERPATDPNSYGTTRSRDDNREGSRRPAPTTGGRGGYDLDDDIPF